MTKIHNDYYTYAYLREDKTPYYIGKGKGNRAFLTKRVGAKPPKDKSRIIYLKQNLTEEEAFKHEVYMIFVLGRKDLGTGILHNMTNGGEGLSGAIRSDETRRKMSEAGKNRSEETKKKMSESGKVKIFSKEHRIKLSEANKGKTHSEKSKQKMKEALKGRPAHNKGKPTSEETKRKMSEAQKGKPAHSKGTKWWNDGCGNCKMMLECPGDGWKPGRK